MKRGLLRSVGRWGVFAVTALVFVVIPVSFFVRPGVSVMYEHSNAAQTIQPRAIGFSRGSIVYQSTYTFDGAYQGGPKNPGWRWSFRWHSIYDQGWARGATWWKPHWTDAQPMGLQIDFPLLYFCVLSAMLSGTLIRSSYRLRHAQFGSCGVCGYSLVGLDGGVCPECGGEG